MTANVVFGVRLSKVGLIPKERQYDLLWFIVESVICLLVVSVY